MRVYILIGSLILIGSFCVGNDREFIGVGCCVSWVFVLLWSENRSDSIGELQTGNLKKVGVTSFSTVPMLS